MTWWRRLTALDLPGFAGALAEAARAAAAHPGPVVAATAGLAAASGPVALRAVAENTSGNPLYAVLRAEHDLLAAQLRAAAAGAAPHVGSSARRRLDLLAEQAVAATAPEHWPLTNPDVLRAALETGGRSLARGAATPCATSSRTGACRARSRPARSCPAATSP
ncbi:hypothetical protein BJF78_32305 [Pseudonocardia sp. CNS-139]|nr:hypothetical protein BJF78_32305 [Pseudonocardia sp. CNS-139]